MKETDIYCLHCLSARQEAIIRILERMGYTPFAPLEIKRDYRTDPPAIRKRYLIPGYVFFNADQGVLPDWSGISRVDGVIRPLEYDDHSKAFRGEDLAFVYWLKGRSGIVDISKVIRVGTKIRVVEGPLKYYEGRIKRVNKSRKSVAIEIGNAGLLNVVWFPVEYVESAE